MRLIKGVLRRRIDFIVQFLLKIEIGIWNSFFDLMMKTKTEKKSKLYFILKQKSNVPFDPRNFVIVKLQNLKIISNWTLIFVFKLKVQNGKINQFSIFNLRLNIES